MIIRWSISWFVCQWQHFYCPQQSWGKVIFSEECVKNSVHCGGCGIPACLAGLQAQTQGQVEGSVGGSLHAHIQGGKLRGLARGSPGPHLEGSLGPHLEGSSGLHPGVCVYASMHWGWHHPPSADGYCCGQYTSYWKTFLCKHHFTQCHKTAI